MLDDDLRAQALRHDGNDLVTKILKLSVHQVEVPVTFYAIEQHEHASKRLFLHSP